ncbi:7819_t:CDS:2, partial [Acaulospora colombiana]
MCSNNTNNNSASNPSPFGSLLNQTSKPPFAASTQSSTTTTGFSLQQPIAPFTGFGTSQGSGFSSNTSVGNSTTSLSSNPPTFSVSSTGFGWFGKTQNADPGKNQSSNTSTGFSALSNTKSQATFGGFGGSLLSTSASTSPFATFPQPSSDGGKKDNTIGFNTSATSAPKFGSNPFNLGTTSKTTQAQSAPAFTMFTGFKTDTSVGSEASNKNTTTLASLGASSSGAGHTLNSTSGSNIFARIGSTSQSTQSSSLNISGNLFGSSGAKPLFDTSKKDNTGSTTSSSSLFATASVTTNSSVNIPKTTMPTFTATITSPIGGGGIKSSLTPSFSTTKPITTSAPPLIGGIGTSSLRTTSTTTPSTTATSVPTSGADQIPSWLKNNNIEGIINKWTKDLDNCSKKFHEQIKEVNQWDQKIIENNGRVTRLGEQINKADSIQAEIEAGLNNIESRQEELDKILSEYEQKFGDPALETLRPLDKERERS